MKEILQKNRTAENLWIVFKNEPINIELQKRIDYNKYSTVHIQYIYINKIKNKIKKIEERDEANKRTNLMYEYPQLRYDDDLLLDDY